MSGVKVVQICEATIYCATDATLWATFWTKDRSGLEHAGRPLACCDEHRKLCEDKAEARRIKISFAPIGGSIPELRVVKES